MHGDLATPRSRTAKHQGMYSARTLGGRAGRELKLNSIDLTP